MSSVTQVCILGPVFFDMFICDVDSGTECTLSEYVDSTKLSSAFDTKQEGVPSRGTLIHSKGGPM